MRKSVVIQCPKCRPGSRAKPLPDKRVTQGRFGNCAACFRNMRIAIKESSR
jgi:hypothetical protein